MPNKFPAFGPWESEPERDGLFTRRTAIGSQEVVVHSPRHVVSLADLAARELADVAAAWQERVAFGRNRGLPFAQVIVNEGRAAGASLAHSHSQLFCLPEEPPAWKDERRAQVGHGCVLCDLLAEESARRVRLVAERDGVVLLCSYAGRAPYELLIAPLACEPDAFSSARLADAIELASDGVRRLRLAEGAVPFNAWIRPGPHWRLELVPRLAVFAGLELGAGYFVNTMAPESAAGILREA